MYICYMCVHICIYMYTYIHIYIYNMGMHSHILGYPSIWECNSMYPNTWGCIPMCWGSKLYGNVFPYSGVPHSKKQAPTHYRSKCWATACA